MGMNIRIILSTTFVTYLGMGLIKTHKRNKNKKKEYFFKILILLLWITTIMELDF